MADALSRVGRRAGTRSELEAMVHGASRVRDVYRAPSLFGRLASKTKLEVGGSQYFVNQFCFGMRMLSTCTPQSHVLY
jgi:hypothetical protein